MRANRLFRPIAAVAIASIGGVATLSLAATAPQGSAAPAHGENPALQHEAYAMMGDIQVADVDLMNGYAREASRHINKALRLSQRLEKATAQFNAAAVKAGHLQYSDTDGHKHDYWLPVVNGRMVVNNLSESFGKGVKPLQAADEAQLVTVSTSIDVKAIHADLEKAARSLAANDRRTPRPRWAKLSRTCSPSSWCRWRRWPRHATTCCSHGTCFRARTTRQPPPRCGTPARL